MVLERGQVVAHLDDAPGGWLHVYAEVNSVHHEGFLLGRHVGPVGAAAPVDEPLPSLGGHRVAVDGLNFRSTPESAARQNLLGVLRRGQIVHKLADARRGFWKVRTPEEDGGKQGFVAARYLTPA